MSPETREILDYLVAFLSPAAGGGILLAFLGWLKAGREKAAHIAEPANVGQNALAHIGGMVMGRQLGEDIVTNLAAVAASQDRCTLVREQEIRLAREVSEQRHGEMRKLNDHLDTLCDRLKNLPQGHA